MHINVCTIMKKKMKYIKGCVKEMSLVYWCDPNIKEKVGWVSSNAFPL